MTRQRITFEIDTKRAVRSAAEPLPMVDYGYIPGSLVVEDLPEPIVDRFELVITSDPADGGVGVLFLEGPLLQDVQKLIGSRRTVQFFRVTKAGS